MRLSAISSAVRDRPETGVQQIFKPALGEVQRIAQADKNTRLTTVQARQPAIERTTRAGPDRGKAILAVEDGLYPPVRVIWFTERCNSCLRRYLGTTNTTAAQPAVIPCTRRESVELVGLVALVGLVGLVGLRAFGEVVFIGRRLLVRIALRVSMFENLIQPKETACEFDSQTADRPGRRRLPFPPTQSAIGSDQQPKTSRAPHAADDVASPVLITFDVNHAMRYYVSSDQIIQVR